MAGGRRPRAALPCAALVVTLAAAACSGDDSSGSEAGSGKGEISVWAHQGPAAENKALQQIVADFNRSQDDVEVDLRLIPATEYTRTITATDPSELPDVLEFDGPLMANFVYNGKLTPINPYVSSEVVDNATAAIRDQGTAAGELYGLGMYDSGLGIYGNKRLLDAAGIDYPKGLDDAWTAEEFDAALARLAEADSDGKVLDIRENDGLATEWGTYGFSPIVWSAGGGLIKDNKAAGVLDTPGTAAAMRTFQSWRPYVDPNPGGNAMERERVALSWVGHWMYPLYSAALGSDLVVMPLPDFGNGVKTGQGSWAWGMGAQTKNGKAAGTFLAHLLSDRSVTAMTDANGAPPGTRSVLAKSRLYQPGGPLRLFAEQLDRPCGDVDVTRSCVAVTRPVTAGYPVVTSEFSRALSGIYGGEDPQEQLASAARSIDRDYRDNDDYPLD